VSALLLGKNGTTAQEELHDVGLVHLNGCVYDPLIARMTSADPMVPDPPSTSAATVRVIVSFLMRSFSSSC